MQLALVTAAYTGIRNDRPASYYLKTINELLEQIKDHKDLIIYVFTNKENNENIVRGSNIILRNDPIDDMVKETWSVDNWLAEVKKMGPKMPVQQKYPETIGIYLSKFAMIRRVAKETKLPILWLDSGHGISQRGHYAALGNRAYIHSKQSAYKPLRVDPDIMVNNCLNLLKNPITMMISGTFPHQLKDGIPEMYIFGVPMKRYMVEFDAHLKGNEHISACVLLIQNEMVEYYFSKIHENWNRLISDGVLGHEENAMVMFYWQHPDAKGLHYNDWFNLLGFKKPIRIPPAILNRKKALKVPVLSGNINCLEFNAY